MFFRIYVLYHLYPIIYERTLVVFMSWHCNEYRDTYIFMDKEDMYY